jgi:hypothetical protein
MAPGRNDPCPCGSGRKFKQCHGAAGANAVEPGELVWRRTRRALDGFAAMMLRFTLDVYGAAALDEAWAEFLVWPEDDVAFDPGSPHVPVFMPWFFHRWAPDLDTGVADTTLHGRPPTSVLLERRAARLDPSLRSYLEACLRAPFSFHEIVRCDRGRGFRARDVFTLEEHEVLERSASQTLQPGDALFAQLVETGGITMLEACSPVVIPPRNRLALIDLRQRLAATGRQLTRALIDDWDIEIRELYLDTHDELTTPQLPHLQNTDGEDVVPHRLIFDIDSAAEAFAALTHLAVDHTESELLESAEYGVDGVLQRVSLPWVTPGNRVHRSWNNTLLGQITIDGRRLTAEVNSAERAARLREMIQQSLGPRARHRATEIQDIESALAAARDNPISPPDAEPPPEAAAEVHRLMAAHYEEWVTQSVPALDGLTPLEAVGDEHGREKVRALVAAMERSARQLRPPMDEGAIRRLKDRLGLS